MKPKGIHNDATMDAEIKVSIYLFAKGENDLDTLFFYTNRGSGMHKALTNHSKINAHLMPKK